MNSFPENVAKAIRSGPIPVFRDWRNLPYTSWTRAERIMAFAEEYLLIPEGSLVGQPIHLEPFQEAFIYAVFDNPVGTRTAVLSMARKNAKTVTCAIILLAFIVGPEALANSMISSGAMAREQAAIVFKHMQKFINLSPDLPGLTHVTPSAKKIVGLAKNVEFTALAKDGSRAVGRSDRVVLGDEWGQITAPTDDFVDALITGQGAFDDALSIIISTQAQNDQAYLSTIIDDATRSNDLRTVCHVYEADKNCELLDETQWEKANPAIDKFRSRQDIKDQMTKAQRLPATEAKMRNLILNQRVAQENLFAAPSIWRDNSGEPDLDVFRNNPVSVGLDLSQRTDLTAAVYATKDQVTELVHVLPYVFVPGHELEERARRDRAPYDLWVRERKMFAIGGNAMSYDQIADFLVQTEKQDLDFNVTEVHFDRWRIKDFKSAATKAGLWQEAEWHSVGQGYKDMSPVCEATTAVLAERRMRHGGHPLLNSGISSAIAVQDPSGNTKLHKAKSTSRIDQIIALVMAVAGVELTPTDAFDVAAMIG